MFRMQRGVARLKDPRRSRDYSVMEMMDLYDLAIAIAELNVEVARETAVFCIVLVIFCLSMWLLCLI